MTNPSIITLLTDFGDDDTFVGVMKGVILGIAPATHIVDLTHRVSPQDIRAAAIHLADAVPFFPDGTVHTVVVDPGVGGQRRAIAVRTDRAIFVAPDNGVLSVVFDRAPPLQVVEVTNPAYRLPRVSATFHGRDVFAPAAAHLASGVSIDALGDTVDNIVSLPLERPQLDSDGCIRGHVRQIDHFGNIVTDIPAKVIPEGRAVTISVAGVSVENLSATYSSVQESQPVALVSSGGRLELAVRDGNAAKEFGVKIGDQVVVKSNGPQSG